MGTAWILQLKVSKAALKKIEASNNLCSVYNSYKSKSIDQRKDQVSFSQLQICLRIIHSKLS